MRLHDADLYKELIFHQLYAQLMKWDESFEQNDGVLAFDENKEYLFLTTSIAYHEKGENWDSEIIMMPTSFAHYGVYQINEACTQFLRPIEHFLCDESMYMKRMNAQKEFYISQEEVEEPNEFSIESFNKLRKYRIPLDDIATYLAQSEFTYDTKDIEKAFIYGGWQNAIENPLIRTGLSAYELEAILNEKPIVKKPKI